MRRLHVLTLVICLLCAVVAPSSAQAPEFVEWLAKEAAQALEHSHAAQIAEHALEGAKAADAAAEAAAKAGKVGEAAGVAADPAELNKELQQLRGATPKYHEEQIKFYERYSTVDREYFAWFSAAELKKPFNQLVDDAIVSIRASSGAKTFKNAGNQQIVDALASQPGAAPARAA